MSEEYHTQQIEHYLKGTLIGSQLQQFEKALQSDAALQEEVVLEQQAQALTKLFGQAHLKERLEDFEDMPQQGGAKIVPLFRKISAAAAIILVLVLAVFLINDFEQKPANTADLFEQNFETYRDPVSVRSQTISANKLWNLGANNYAQKSFEEAAKNFQTYIETEDAEFYLAHFYLGASLLAQEKPAPQDAITAFQKVLESDNDYREQAKWYMGLGYLKLEDREGATAILEEIVNNQAYKSKEATEILKNLAYAK